MAQFSRSTILFVVLNILLARALFADTGYSVNQILNRYQIPLTEVGFVVGHSNGSTLLLHNAGRSFIPASITKVLVAAAAIDGLGADYRFRTVIFADSPPENGVIHGSVYLKGGGDPSFFSDKSMPALKKFPSLLDGFTRAGIHTIEGDIIVDDSRFEEYSADSPAAAREIIFSWGRSGAPLFLKIDPAAKSSVPVRRIFTVRSGVRNDFVVYQNVIEPDLWTGIDLAAQLRDRGISISGTVKRGKAVSGGYLISEVATPLNRVLQDMLKKSNNYYAEMLAMNLAAEFISKPGTVENGLKYVSGYLKKNALKESNYRLVSAAGFSYRNQITPSSMFQLLAHLRGDSGKSIVDALPISGIDGTLRNRLTNSIATGRVFAKTGKLPGAVSLAGFIYPQKGEPLIFVLMYNGSKSSAKVTKAFDQICMALSAEESLFRDETIHHK